MFFEDLCAILGQNVCTTIASAFVLILVILGVLVVALIVLLVMAVREMRSIEVPPDADFFETMRLIPITVPLALDLLDFIFDSVIPVFGGFLGAPISWLLLDTMGLKSLRAITAVESFIPATQLIPTLTAGWVLARTLKPSGPSEAEVNYRSRSRRKRRQSASYDLPEWSDKAAAPKPELRDEQDWIDEEDF